MLARSATNSWEPKDDAPITQVQTQPFHFFHLNHLM